MPFQHKIRQTLNIRKNGPIILIVIITVIIYSEITQFLLTGSLENDNELRAGDSDSDDLNLNFHLTEHKPTIQELEQAEENSHLFGTSGSMHKAGIESKYSHLPPTSHPTISNPYHDPPHPSPNKNLNGR